MFRDELPGCIGGSAVLLLGDDPDSDSLVVRGDGMVPDVLLSRLMYSCLYANAGVYLFPVFAELVSECTRQI